MMKKKQITVLIITLLVIGAVIISACASGALAQPKSELEAQVGTAAAATVVQHMIETQVAIQSGSKVAEVAVQATQAPAATATPLPTNTPLPTAVPTQAATPTAVPTLPPTAAAPAAAAVGGPRIVADANTNCRSGPSTAYTILTVFAKGTESSVEGRNSNKNWWYIANPNGLGQSCWVWEGSTTVVGDTSTVAVVAAPQLTYPKVSNWNYDDNGYCGNVFCPGYYDDDYVYYGCVDYYPYNYWPNCCPKNKWTCSYPYVTCTCKVNPNYKVVCKKSNCPPVTIVNYKKYCKNYPQCCRNLDVNNLSGN